MSAALEPHVAASASKSERWVVTQPGIYDIPNVDYQRDPVPRGSLSFSGAKSLLKCPAKYKWDRDHGRPPKREFDFGHAAHKLVLGVGDDLVVVDADDWRTKDAKSQRSDAYTEGKVPLLACEYAQVEAMASAIRDHPVASKLFAPGSGSPEMSAFWEDGQTGVVRRCRFDWLPNPVPGRRMIVPDYKTAISSDPLEFDRSMHSYGYHQQSDWYTEAIRTLGIGGRDTEFVFVVQEKTPPYVVSVIQPDPTAKAIGRILNREALRLYAECTRTGIWPGYSDEVELVGVPRWVERQYTDQELFG